MIAKNIENINIKVGAIEIEEGKTYAIESPMALSEEAKNNLKRRLHLETNAHFVVLDCGLKIARAEIDY